MIKPTRFNLVIFLGRRSGCDPSIESKMTKTTLGLLSRLFIESTKMTLGFLVGGDPSDWCAKERKKENELGGVQMLTAHVLFILTRREAYAI